MLLPANCVEVPRELPCVSCSDDCSDPPGMNLRSAEKGPLFAVICWPCKQPGTSFSDPLVQDVASHAAMRHNAASDATHILCRSPLHIALALSVLL